MTLAEYKQNATRWGRVCFFMDSLLESAIDNL